MRNRKMAATAEFHGGDESILYSENDKPRVQNLFYVSEVMMMVTGQLPLRVHYWLPKALHPVGRNIARFYSAFSIFSIMHVGVLLAITTLDELTTGELEKITDDLTTTIIYFFAGYSVCYWLYYADELEAFFGRICREYRHHSMAGGSFVSAHSSYIQARNFAAIWEATVVAGTFFWGTTPLLMKTGKLPLEIWYPFDQYRPGVYGPMYCLQLFIQVIMGICFANGSSMIVVLAFILLAQFDVLFCSLKNLDFHARLIAGEDLNELQLIADKQLNGTSEDELNQYAMLDEYKTDLRVFQHVKRRRSTSATNLKAELHSSLVECVRLHRFIMESCDTLEELFSPFCLVKSLQLTMQLCLLVFVAVQGERTVIKILNQLQYVCLTASELLMFTYCGELLRIHSVRAGEAFWRSNWFVNGNAHLIRTDILIFLVNTKRFVKMTAGKFFTMDVNRFRSVVTQAFSFLTLLQKLAAKKDEAMRQDVLGS